MADQYNDKYVKNRRVQAYPKPNTLKIIQVLAYDRGCSISQIVSDLLTDAIAQYDEKEQLRLLHRHAIIDRD